MLSTMTTTVIRHVIRSVVWPDPATLPDIRDPERRRHWRTGDLVIFASYKGDAILINMVSGVPWTHVGILVWVPEGDPRRPEGDAGESARNDRPAREPGRWFMWHSDSPSSRPNAHGKTDADTHNGTQLVPLDFYLATTESVAVHVPMPAAGGITVPDLDTLTLQIHESCKYGRKYGFDDHSVRLISVAISNSPLETHVLSRPAAGEDPAGWSKSWFCSAFVAHVFRLWGWDMAGAPDPHAFHPKHYLVWAA
jgi:hypothetical protein